MTGSRWDLDGRVALVTGGTRGIGRAIAEALLDHGASVMITARTGRDLDRVATELAGRGRIETFAAAAGDPLAVDASVGRCIERLAGLDILVNNAATNPQFGPLLEADRNAIEKVWSVNVHGVLDYCRSAWHRVMSERGGAIINVASVSGLAPTPLSGAYNVGKAALVHLSRQLSLELAPQVRVNTLVPGLVRTRFASVQLEDEADAAARHPLGRVGAPSDLAGAAVFLASDASGWMTGQELVVDGGALQAWWPLAHA